MICRILEYGGGQWPPWPPFLPPFPASLFKFCGLLTISELYLLLCWYSIVPIHTNSSKSSDFVTGIILVCWFYGWSIILDLIHFFGKIKSIWYVFDFFWRLSELYLDSNLFFDLIHQLVPFAQINVLSRPEIEKSEKRKRKYSLPYSREYKPVSYWSTCRPFQISYEGDFRSLCTVTFWQKVDFLISNAC